MQTLTVEMLGTLARLGAIMRARIVYRSDADGWVVMVDHKDPKTTAELHTERGEVRIFKRLDTAFRALRDSGWQGEISVLGDGP